MFKILTIDEIDMQVSYPITSLPSSNSPLYTKAASPSYFLTSAGCFVARNFTSSVSLSCVASLSWPGGVGASTSARMGRRVGVREMIVGLDSWSVWRMGLAVTLVVQIGQCEEWDGSGINGGCGWMTYKA